MKIAFHTLGCKVNQYETQALKEAFLQRGDDIVSDDDFADVYVINTCTVTGLSDRKSRQFIRRVKRINPDSITAVIGCYVQVSPEEAGKIEGVDLLAGTNEKSRLPELIEAYREKRRVSPEKETHEPDVHLKAFDELTVYEETGVITAMDSRTRAYLKVQEGCDRFCSYCIIPYARGPLRSRAKADIIKEAEHLIAQGYKELVLTGINTALYGREAGFPSEEGDLYGIEIVIHALDQLEGDFRIRLGSLEPNVIDVDYAKRLLRYSRLCPHMHLSLQSGSDRILRLMNRRYDASDYQRLVEALRENNPHYGITTDIIVGFPRETEEDFQASVDVVRNAGLSKVHVFKYSKRSGTKAADMPEQVDPQVKSLRSEALMRVAQETATAFLTGNLGTVREVLLERKNPDTGYWEGFTENYIKVYVKVERGEDLLNQFLQVKLISPYGEGVVGEFV